MKFQTKFNSRKIGTILAVLFILGLSVSTIYSRSYAQRQKPFVHIALPESSTLHWSYEARSNMRPANEEERAKGGATEWVTELTVPYEAYRNDMGELAGTSATLTTDGGILPTQAQNLFRTNMDNGDVLMVLGYESTGHSWDGEGVTVNIEHKGITDFDNLVPYQAIQQDTYTREQYIFVVNNREGAWGTEYYAQRMNVTMGIPASVKGFANITSPSLQDKSFVLSAEEEIYDGEMVRIFD